MLSYLRRILLMHLVLFADKIETDATYCTTIPKQVVAIMNHFKMLNNEMMW